MTPLYFNAPWSDVSMEAADDEFEFAADEEEETLPDEEFEFDEDPVDDTPADDVGDDILDDTDDQDDLGDMGEMDEIVEEDNEAEIEAQAKEDKREDRKDKKARNAKAVAVLKKGSRKTTKAGYKDQPKLAIFLPEREGLESYFGTVQVPDMQLWFMPWNYNHAASLEGMQAMQAHQDKQATAEATVEKEKDQDKRRFYDHAVYGIGAGDQLYETLEVQEEDYAWLLDDEGAFTEEELKALEETFGGRVFKSVDGMQQAFDLSKAA